VVAGAAAVAAAGRLTAAVVRGAVVVVIGAAEARAIGVMILLALAARPGAAQQARWVMGPQAKLGVQELWARSVATRREQVACLGGFLGADTVHVNRLQPVDEPSDSLNASAQLSLASCAPPEWIGVVHSHVRSTDDDTPASRFSPGDRAVMSEWTQRWGGQGAFCLVYSTQNMHCEVYPPRRNRPVIEDSAQ
jgi:hypothetical protein